MDIRLSVVGTDRVGKLAELASWLSQEPDLRGHVRHAAAVPAAGELGAVADSLVAALGAGGAVSALAASLRGFLAQPRRSDVRIIVVEVEGRRVELDAKRVDDVDGLLRRVLGQDE